MFYPDYKSVEGDHGAKMSDFWHTELDNKKGLTVVEIINAAYDGELKGYILWVKIQLCQTLIKIMLGQP